MCYVCLPVVSLQLYHDLSVFILSPLAFHIDTTTLSDGTYELIPESDGGDLEAQVNTAVLPQLVSELQAYTRDVGTLKTGFLIKLEQQGISENYVGIVKGCA